MQLTLHQQPLASRNDTFVWVEQNVMKHFLQVARLPVVEKRSHCVITLPGYRG